MAKTFAPIVHDPVRCRRELKAFAQLLAMPELSEQKDILPFFKQRSQLSAYIGMVDPRIGTIPELAFEFSFLGDFTADLVIGNRAKGHFLAVEFEDGRNNSIFTKRPNKSTTEWSRRFDHGFSQLVDWFCILDDFKKTDRFKRDFGDGHITFSGLLVVGRNAGLSPADRIRLNWRASKVVVDSRPISCVTFDDLYEDLANRLRIYPHATPFEK